MKCQLIILAAICLACTYSLPVPDEEVSVVQAAPVNEVKSDVAKKPEEKPVDAVSAVKAVESRAVEELKPAAEPAPAVVAAAAPAGETAAANEAVANEAQPELKKSTETKADLKSDVPDVETAPAIPEKKLIAEAEKKPLTAAPLEEAKKEAAPAEEKPEKKAARTEEEPLEAPKAVPLVEAPAANVEVQKQIVDEAKPAVHPALVAAGKSSELPKETKLEGETKKEEKLETAAPTEETPAKKLPVEEFKEPQTAERAIELKTDEVKTDAINANEPAAPVAATTATEEGAAQKEKKLNAEEKQPARQERINEQEKDAAEAKPENNVQVIPAASTKSVASEEIKPAEQTAAVAAPATPDAQPELKQGLEQAKPIAETQLTDANIKSDAKESEQPTAATLASESEPRKIDEPKETKAPVASDDLAGQENKAEPAAKKGDETLKKSTDEKKNNSSDEKSELEKKSDESKDSSESKESDENDNSKEDKSN